MSGRTFILSEPQGVQAARSSALARLTSRFGTDAYRPPGDRLARSAGRSS
jgi:hypothetical protein